MPMRYLTSTNCLWCESFPDGPSGTADEVGEVCKGEMSIHSAFQMGKCGGSGVSPIWEVGCEKV